MEDTKHFLAQNGLNGAIFFVFALGAWFLLQPEGAIKIISSFLSMQNATALLSFVFAAVLAPIIGYSVQAVVLTMLYLMRWSYADNSRRIIAEEIRQRILAHAVISNFRKELVDRIADDSIFVALFYREAPGGLIEWERRRRDTQHLGENWAAAAFLGVLVSLSLIGIIDLPDDSRRLISVLVGVVILISWISGLLYMRLQMKRDADGMDLIWALTYLHPELMTNPNGNDNFTPATPPAKLASD